jgi:hypothetical protein
MAEQGESMSTDDHEIELRWLHQRVEGHDRTSLQYRARVTSPWFDGMAETSAWTDWQDVPEVEE